MQALTCVYKASVLVIFTVLYVHISKYYEKKTLHINGISCKNTSQNNDNHANENKKYYKTVYLKYINSKLHIATILLWHLYFFFLFDTQILKYQNNYQEISPFTNWRNKHGSSPLVFMRGWSLICTVGSPGGLRWLLSLVPKALWFLGLKQDRTTDNIDGL